MSRWCDSKVPWTFLHQEWRVSFEIQRAFHSHLHWGYREKGGSLSDRYRRAELYKWNESPVVSKNPRWGPNKVFGKQQGVV